jgi:predicted phosphohydrolase
MKLRYFSDLHLEFIKPNEIEEFIRRISPGMDEVCILAGDIGNPYQSNYDIFMKFISTNFKKTFFIPGNHEYYNKTQTIEKTKDFMENYFKKYDNIRFLNNSYELYDGYCFIGTTLWTKITNPRYQINDVNEIPHFDYIKYNKLHEESVYFLEDALQNNTNCVVITHHVPSDSLIDTKYKTLKMLPYNQWFYCNMDELIETNKDKIKCWIYGHTHMPSNVIINDIPFLCNPIGYPNENVNVNFQLTHSLNP